MFWLFVSRSDCKVAAVRPLFVGGRIFGCQGPAYGATHSSPDNRHDPVALARNTEGSDSALRPHGIHIRTEPIGHLRNLPLLSTLGSPKKTCHLETHTAASHHLHMLCALKLRKTIPEEQSLSIFKMQCFSFGAC